MTYSATSVVPRPYLTAKERNFRIAGLVWTLVFVSFVSFRSRAPEELLKPGGIDLQAKLQAAAWIGFGLLALRLLLSRRAELKLLLYAPLTWFCMFAGLSVLSTFYSAAPALTLFRSGQVVVVILLVISLRENLNRFYPLIGLYLAANWLLFLVANSGLVGIEWNTVNDNNYLISAARNGLPWRFGSPLDHPSTISVVGAAGTAGLMARTHRANLRRNLPVILFFAITVLLTISRTAIAGMLLGMLVVLVVRGRTIPVALIGGILLPLAVMIPSIGGRVVQYGMRGQSAAEFKNLTGRAEIYQKGIERARQSLPLGEGFVAGRAKAIVSKDLGYSITHSHNLFIESTIGMGVLGLGSAIMVLLTWAVSLCRAVKIPADETGISPGWEPLVMSIPLAAFCILDRGFAGSAGPFLCLFVAVLAYTTKLLLVHRTAWAGNPLTIHP
jgi:O-antigen ligase